MVCGALSGAMVSPMGKSASSRPIRNSAQQDEDESAHDPAQVRRLAAQHCDLEHDEDADDRGHVQGGRERGNGKGAKELHAQTTMP